jgi:hypothetical protein
MPTNLKETNPASSRKAESNQAAANTHNPEISRKLVNSRRLASNLKPANNRRVNPAKQAPIPTARISPAMNRSSRVNQNSPVRRSRIPRSQANRPNSLPT